MKTLSRRKFLSLASALLTAGCGGGGGGGDTGNTGNKSLNGGISPSPAPIGGSNKPPPPPPSPGANVIERENAKTAREGVTTAWYIEDEDYASNREIEGYASATSVNRGQSIKLYVNTAEPTYTISIYRVGWYGGAGGRLVAGPIRRNGLLQPTPTHDPATHLVECHWTDPYTLSIPDNSSDPTDWASGVYLAKLTAGVSGKQSYIIFVVRHDVREAALHFQASVTTYAAYNNWGGYNFYAANSAGGQPAYKLSFNRPYYNPQQPYGGKGAGDFLGWELLMLRFLEREGYDVSYTTNIAVDNMPARLMQHRAFLSVGHDEYWTRSMRDAMEGARNNGVHLGFFGANAGYWQVRLEASSSGEPNRTVVGYKYYTADYDPMYNIDRARATFLWRDPAVGRPEAALIGVMYDYNSVDLDMVMADCSGWIFKGTGLRRGDVLKGMLGYEVDRVDPVYSPENIQILASSPYIACVDEQCSSGELRYANMTYYTHSSGAGIFATGSMQWNWGLDDFGPWGDRVNPAVQQITRNVMDRFVQE
jgi:hypothetical protein